MKRKRRFVYWGIILAFFMISVYAGLALSSTQEDNALKFDLLRGCTSILVGKKASVDGSVMTTHTADCGMCDWTWRYIPAAEHEQGSVRKIYHIHQIRTWPPEVGQKWDAILTEGYTGKDIPQVPRTYAYIHGIFGYMNEHQLAMGESTIGCRAKMRNPTPAATFDITMLTLLAMERCKTARDAIKLMGELAEKHGYGFHDGGEMLAIADPHEAWLFEIMPAGPLWTPESGKPGAVWCAQRIPDDHVGVCPNESRIGEIDLADTDHFMASPNVISFAVEKGFYDPKSGEPFSWKKAYSPVAGSAKSTQARRGRLWRFFDLVAPSKKFSSDTPNMDLPFSVKPDKKLSLEDLIAIMRDKYQRTPFDPVRGIMGGPFKNPHYFAGFTVDGENYTGPRCICIANVEYTTVTVCRSWLPNPIGGLIWLSFGAQDTSCYMPLYAGMTAIPASFSIGDHWHLDRNSARWAFDYVDFHTQIAYSYAIQDVKAAQNEWETGAISKWPAIDKTALELHNQDPDLAKAFLTDYCIHNANKVINAWWELGDNLFVKYNHLRIYDVQNRRVQRLKYPEWWNRAVVEHDKLTPLQREEER